MEDRGVETGRGGGPERLVLSMGDAWSQHPRQPEHHSHQCREQEEDHPSDVRGLGESLKHPVEAHGEGVLCEQERMRGREKGERERPLDCVVLCLSLSDVVT